MKPSRLRQIIKEEIDKALNDKINQSFNDKVGVKPVDPSIKNVMKEKPTVKKPMKEEMEYETLPGYNELPATRFDVKNYMIAKYITLPSVESANASSQLYSKEDVKDWFNDWKMIKGEAPQFKVENGKIKVVNADEPNWDAMKGSGD